MQLDKRTLGALAKDLGFVRDTLEKVCRLAEILKFMQEDELLSRCLALKGGTAINLMIFDLPRLSVDIDLDYCKGLRRDEMLSDRQIITSKISKYMLANDYTLSSRSKSYHALDSFVYEYKNAGGVKDNIKIEINYMLRCHLLPVIRREVKLPWSRDELKVLTIDPIEIFASKTVALLTRTAPRDLYDIHNMIKHGLFDKAEEEMLRKCAAFYSAIGAEHPPENFSFGNIDKVSKMQIKRDLYPVLRKGETFDLKAVQEEAKGYMSAVLIPTEEEKEFWREFSAGNYRPELIFGERQEPENVRSHPMAIWKCEKNKLK